MQIINNCFKLTRMPYNCYLVLLLSLATTCLSKKRPQTDSAKLKQSCNSPSTTTPVAPRSNQAKNNSNNTPPATTATNQAPISNQTKNKSNNTPPAITATNQTPIIYNSSSGKEDQVATIRDLNTVIQKNQKHNESFSQKLSKIQDLSERDKEIASFVKDRNLLIESFNLRLKNVLDPIEKQRLMSEFMSINKMNQELKSCVPTSFDSSKQSIKAFNEEIRKKQGDVIEVWTGYPIESQRPRIKRRIKELIYFVNNNPSLFRNKQKQGAECAICHESESIGLLPCGDYVHVDCLTESIIAQFRLGMDHWVLECPGSCRNYLTKTYFLDNDTHARTYLSPDRWEEIFYKPKNT